MRRNDWLGLSASDTSAPRAVVSLPVPTWHLITPLLEAAEKDAREQAIDTRGTTNAVNAASDARALRDALENIRASLLLEEVANG